MVFVEYDEPTDYGVYEDDEIERTLLDIELNVRDHHEIEWQGKNQYDDFEPTPKPKTMKKAAPSPNMGPPLTVEMMYAIQP